MAEFACVRAGWSLLLASFSERTIKTTITFAIHEAFYWGSFVPFLIADRIPYFHRWRGAA